MRRQLISYHVSYHIYYPTLPYPIPFSFLQANCKRIVFSSSATVYGTAEPPLSESSQVGVGVTNPYGKTKYFLEEVLRDVTASDPEWGVVLLRYFNPVGAHESGTIGEDPNGIPNNLMPYVQQVAVGKREKLTVFGDDYPGTVDGTGMRDYLHVVDLAAGHLAALEYASKAGGGCEVFNLGTGTALSVLQMVEGMKKACGHDVPYVIGPRRPGDLGGFCSDAFAWRQRTTATIISSFLISTTHFLPIFPISSVICTLYVVRCTLSCPAGSHRLRGS